MYNTWSIRNLIIKDMLPSLLLKLSFILVVNWITQRQANAIYCTRQQCYISLYKNRRIFRVKSKPERSGKTLAAGTAYR